MFYQPARSKVAGCEKFRRNPGATGHGFCPPRLQINRSGEDQNTQEKSKVEPALFEKFVRLDGKIIDVEVSAIPITDEGKPATQVVFHDVTERKQIEDALRESEARFRRRAEELSARI